MVGLAVALGCGEAVIVGLSMAVAVEIVSVGITEVDGAHEDNKQKWIIKTHRSFLLLITNSFLQSTMDKFNYPY
jgi:hypothetical protein